MEESSTTDVSSSKPDLGRATNKAQPDGSDDDNDNTKLVITILTVTLVVAILVMGVVILVVWRRRQLRRRRAAKAAMLRASFEETERIESDESGRDERKRCVFDNEKNHHDADARFVNADSKRYGAGFLRASSDHSDSEDGGDSYCDSYWKSPIDGERNDRYKRRNRRERHWWNDKGSNDGEAIGFRWHPTRRQRHRRTTKAPSMKQTVVTGMQQDESIIGAKKQNVIEVRDMGDKTTAPSVVDTVRSATGKTALKTGASATAVTTAGTPAVTTGGIKTAMTGHDVGTAQTATTTLRATAVIVGPSSMAATARDVGTTRDGALMPAATTERVQGRTSGKLTAVEGGSALTSASVLPARGKGIIRRSRRV